MQPVHYIDCELTFLDNRNAEYRDLEAEALGTPAIAGRVGGDQLGRETVKKLNDWVRNHPEHCSRKELELLGLHLYRIAFETPPDLPLPVRETPIKAAFEGTFRRFRSARGKDRDSVRMRIKLIFHKDAEELAVLPWEFLCRPGGEENAFLAKETQLILTRFVPIKEPKCDVDDASQNLRVLLVTAQPRTEGYIENSDLITEIMTLTKSVGIDVTVFQQRATLNNVRVCISGKDKEPGYRPHIVHFMGHGREQGLAFLKEEELYNFEVKEYERRKARGDTDATAPSEADWVDTESVKSLFGNHKPRVVFLHACKGAAAGSLEGFSSTARALAYSDISAVIAMQYDIGNSQAQLFATTFYRRLRLGDPVDEAVAHARRELGEQLGQLVWNDRSFGTPVIYLQTDKPIFERPPEAERSVNEKSDKMELGKVRCPNGDCPNWLIPDSTFCTKCQTVLMCCPTCSCLMVSEDGVCRKGHRLASEPSKQGDVRSTFEIISSPSGRLENRDLAAEAHRKLARLGSPI